ncbi:MULTISPECIES: hypothetical protein [unclassified Sphingomonas]|jgi:hypothetical protein|uniref:hypothetical protein n=1 Tax=unclassified Sphingomonas TaxID=196159 RepID=UPI0008307837|nr:MULTISPECIES: hypothetical protein [unclassified Sphingomonas]
MNVVFRAAVAAASLLLLLTSNPADAHKLREKGVAVQVADSSLTVTPDRDWNRLDQKPGKNTETWTLDGEQLNDVTFFAGIETGKPLVKERSKKREPLPKFTATTLLVEVPELLEGTYRTYKRVGSFQVLDTQPTTFLGKEGISFSYQYVDADFLTRNGEAKAAIIGGRLFMMTFDAPRLHYFAKDVDKFRALAASARL